MEPRDDAFLFSHGPEQDVPYEPDTVTHRYSKMCRQLGIDSHLHTLRRYSATDQASRLRRGAGTTCPPPVPHTRPRLCVDSTGSRVARAPSHSDAGRRP